MSAMVHSQDTYHKGYAHGVDICELEHYELCTGNIQEGKNRGGHFWRGCPEGFEPSGATGGDQAHLDISNEDVETEEDECSPNRNGVKEFPPDLSEAKELRSSKEDLLLEAEIAELTLMEESEKKV